jgi:hypothetical protein
VSPYAHTMKFDWPEFVIWTESQVFSSGAVTRTQSYVEGIYLFRRREQIAEILPR